MTFDSTGVKLQFARLQHQLNASAMDWQADFAALATAFVLHRQVQMQTSFATLAICINNGMVGQKPAADTPLLLGPWQVAPSVTSVTNIPFSTTESGSQ